MAAPELQTGISDSPMSVTFTPAKPTCKPMSAFTRARLKDLYEVFAFTQPVSQSPVNWTAARKSKTGVKEGPVSGFAVLKMGITGEDEWWGSHQAQQGSLRRAETLTQPPGRASTSSHTLKDLMSSPR